MCRSGFWVQQFGRCWRAELGLRLWHLPRICRRSYLSRRSDYSATSSRSGQLRAGPMRCVGVDCKPSRPTTDFRRREFGRRHPTKVVRRHFFVARRGLSQPPIDRYRKPFWSPTETGAGKASCFARPSWVLRRRGVGRHREVSTRRDADALMGVIPTSKDHALRLRPSAESQTNSWPLSFR